LGKKPVARQQEQDRRALAAHLPELRPYLEEVFDSAKPGAVHFITRYWDTQQNLRTQFQRIILRAGLKPWPKLFHNLRASRETELAETFPIHVVCAWIGNSVQVAADHYLQVPDFYFERAAKSGASALQNAVQQPAARNRTEPQESTQVDAGCDSVRDGATRRKSLQRKGMPLVGLEPTTR
jgi:hypothetical protein